MPRARSSSHNKVSVYSSVNQFSTDVSTTFYSIQTTALTILHTFYPRSKQSGMRVRLNAVQNRIQFTIYGNVWGHKIARALQSVGLLYRFPQNNYVTKHSQGSHSCTGPIMQSLNDTEKQSRASKVDISSEWRHRKLSRDRNFHFYSFPDMQGLEGPPKLGQRPPPWKHSNKKFVTKLKTG